MSTEVNLDKLYENSIKILSDLIGFKTISGGDNNDLINYCENISMTWVQLHSKRMMMKKKE